MNSWAVETRFAGVGGRAGWPGAWVTTAPTRIRRTTPSGVATRTACPAVPTTGSTVPKLISPTRVPAAESVRSQAVRRFTVATYAVRGRGRAVSCRVGTQPG